MFILAITLYALISGERLGSTFALFVACKLIGALAYLKLGYRGL